MSRPSPDKRSLSSSSHDAADSSKRSRSERAGEEESAATAPCLVVTALVPVLPLFHALLDEDDAARLLQLSRAFAAAVLAGFRFPRRVFVIRGTTQLMLWRSFGLVITRMQTAAAFNEPLMDAEGRSLLPPSLIALLLGPEETRRGFVSRSMLRELVDSYQACDMSGMNEAQQSKAIDRLLPNNQWVFPYAAGIYDQPLPLHCLPHGLRFLMFPFKFAQPLLPGSIPPTVHFVEFNLCFAQRLDEGRLPDSVKRVVVHWGIDDAEGASDGPRYGCASERELKAQLRGKKVVVLKQCWWDKTFCKRHGYCLQDGCPEPDCRDSDDDDEGDDGPD